MEWREGEEVREWREQVAQLTDIVTEKNQHIQELETQVRLAIILMTFLQLVCNASWITLLWSSTGLVLVSIMSQGLDLDNSEHVVADCKAYIEALTDKLNTKTEELERLVNRSLLQGRDEEITGLQVIIVLFILEIVF